MKVSDFLEHLAENAMKLMLVVGHDDGGAAMYARNEDEAKHIGMSLEYEWVALGAYLFRPHV